MEPIIPLAAILMPVMLFAIAALGPLLLIALIVWVGFRVVRGGNRREESLNAQRAAQDELRALMSGMEKMERRIENLETILLERGRSGAAERL